jgi:hypothetical protein
MAGYSANTAKWDIYVPEVAPRRGSPLRAARSCLKVSPVAAGLGSYALFAWSTSKLCVLDDEASGFIRSEVFNLTSFVTLHDRTVPGE